MVTVVPLRGLQLLEIGVDISHYLEHKGASRRLQRCEENGQ